MESTILTGGTEEVAEEIVKLLKRELPWVMSEVKNNYFDDIIVKEPKVIQTGSPIGYILLGTDEYPAIFVNPVTKQERDGDAGFKFEISGWLKEDTTEYISNKMWRMAYAIETTLKKDPWLNGTVSGLVVTNTDYDDPFRIKDKSGFFIAFMIEASYIN